MVEEYRLDRWDAEKESEGVEAIFNGCRNVNS
jgi:hypothetical protein